MATGFSVETRSTIDLGVSEVGSTTFPVWVSTSPFSTAFAKLIG